jgi:hypothetical protein
MALPLLRASPALAHELTLVIVEAEGGATADAGRGFRLAVDQSPDVSHPPGEDAGDHLGGVDVELVSVDAGLPSTIREVNELLDSGATALIVLSGGSDTEALIASAAARGKVVVAIEASHSMVGGEGGIRLRSGGRPDEGRFAAFAAAYAAASGSAPSDAAALGYDAGRLVDAVVLDLGEHLEPGPALTEAAVAASDGLVLADLEVGRETVARAERPSHERSPSPSGSLLTAAAASAGIVALAAAAVALRRRPPPPRI